MARMKWKAYAENLERMIAERDQRIKQLEFNVEVLEHIISTYEVKLTNGGWE